MTAEPTQPVWSCEALFNKGLLYVSEMERHTADDWQFGFWSALSLELIARAALGHISPTLLADSKDWRNIYHALGHATTAKKFIPHSATTKQVLRILEELLPELTPELVDFCVRHTELRNAELHSGEDVFADLGSAAWLPKYYASCEVLLLSMDKTLDDLVDDPKAAKKMISSLEDTAVEAVNRDIDTHKQLWERKTADEQRTSLEQATVWATRLVGHRAECPACGSPSLIYGSRQGAVSTKIHEDMIVQKQKMLPSSFKCVACTLRISGLSKLSACGLGDTFTETSSYWATDFFGLHTKEELEMAVLEAASEPDWEEPDFNE